MIHLETTAFDFQLSTVGKLLHIQKDHKPSYEMKCMNAWKTIWCIFRLAGFLKQIN